MSAPMWDNGEGWSDERWEQERRASIIVDCREILERGAVTLEEADDLQIRYCELEGNIVGGSLHIVLDDGNHERRFVQSSIDWAAQHGDVAGELLGRVLLLIDDATRARWLNPNGES